MNRVIFGKNRCGVKMKYECLVVEKFSFVNMVEMREIWSRGELFYTQQTASFNLALLYTICADKEKVGITTEPRSKLNLGSSRF